MADYYDCIVFLLAKAYQKSQSNLKKRLQPYGLTPLQAFILEVLWEEEGLTAGEIAKRLVFDNATISGVLERLSDSGWIIKKTDTKDKRALRICLSNQAASIKPQLIEIRKSVNEEMLKEYSFEERILFKRMLKDFI